MSEESMRETVAEEAAEQIDITTLISEDNIQEGVNGKEMGIAIGRWAGERVGRSAGETVGMTLHEIFSSGPEHRNFWEVCIDTKEEVVSWIRTVPTKDASNSRKARNASKKDKNASKKKLRNGSKKDASSSKKGRNASRKKLQR